MSRKFSNGIDLAGQAAINVQDPVNPQDAATRAFVIARIDALIAAAPGALDTLIELAAALGNDPNFAATMTTALAGKVAKADYNAQTVLVAVADDTPLPITLGASTVLGRRASGDAVAVTYAQLLSDLGVGAGYAVAIGDGATTSIVVTHNLNSRDVGVTVYRATTPWDEVSCDVQHTDANNVTIIFATAPTAGQYRAVVK